MAEKVKARFCPVCNSVDVKYTFSFGNLFGVIPKQKCGNCGYTGVVFPILVTDKKELKKRGGQEKKKKVRKRRRAKKK